MQPARTSEADYTETRQQLHKALWGISGARKRPRQDFPHTGGRNTTQLGDTDALVTNIHTAGRPDSCYNL